MTLIELLIVAVACALFGLLGRALFGVHGWLLGALPIAVLFVILPILRVIRGPQGKLVERSRQRRRDARNRLRDD